MKNEAWIETSPHSLNDGMNIECNSIDEWPKKAEERKKAECNSIINVNKQANHSAKSI